VRLHVGCAQWTHAAWDLGSKDRLRSYASWCTAVEGNTTFYATPSRSSVESWAAQTSPDFRFVVKLPKTITHERRLRSADAELAAFLSALEPLGPRAHAFWIQLPASFGPADLGALATFMHKLPRTNRYAVEVRHRDFFTDDRAAASLEQVLGRTGAEWVPFDTMTLFGKPATSLVEREAWMNKPRVPRRTRALTDQPIVRYIGRDSADETAAGWQGWATLCAQWLREGRSPTVFIHTPDNALALGLARRFHDDVRALVPELEPLPEPVQSAPPTLF
jgi:uncharacterized protein YecE (DUF72 family)